MATTVVSICNRALSRIGAQLITSLSETSQNAQHCNALYAGARDELLMMHEWSWALARADLTQLVTEYTGWDYAYQLPVDPPCLLPVQMIGVGSQLFQREGSALLCNEDEVELLYIKQVTDPTVFDPLFVEALVLLMASKLAGPIKANKKLEQALIGLFYQKLDEARGQNEWYSSRTPDTAWWTNR